MMLLAALALAAFVAAYLITGQLRRYALRRNLLDRPNERSAHQVPTPRGGGAAIVIAFLVGLAVLAWSGLIAWQVAFGLGGAGLLIALVGFWDDHGHVSARWRLLAHFSAAAWLLGWFGGVPSLSVFGFELPAGPLAYLLAALGIVWILNLYNFMDGIDGIASVEASTVTLGGALAFVVAGAAQHVGATVVLGTSVAGFLVWNWPPAKIFMGDVGSGFLGLVLAGLALHAGLIAPQLLYAWLILLGVFIVDASVTLIHRASRGEKVYEAHRSHAYQRAARHYGSHRAVTLSVAAINLVWLLPVALVVAAGRLDGSLGLVIAYFPLLLLALRWKAGSRDDRSHANATVETPLG